MTKVFREIAAEIGVTFEDLVGADRSETDAKESTGQDIRDLFDAHGDRAELWKTVAVGKA